MVASATLTEITHARIKKVVWAWTSAADGSVSQASVAAYNGKLIGFTTIPSGGGTAPSASYDITITDEQTHDVLLGAGANRHTSNTENVISTSLAGVADSPLTLNVTNAGDTKQGTVILFVQ